MSGADTAGRIAVAGVVALALGAAAARTPPAAPRADASHCTAYFQPPAIRAGADRATVVASFSDVVGAVTSVTVPPHSGLRVLGADMTGSGKEKVRVFLDATDAAPGHWRLRLEGAGERCAGDLTLRPSQRHPSTLESP